MYTFLTKLDGKRYLFVTKKQINGVPIKKDQFKLKKLKRLIRFKH